MNDKEDPMFRTRLGSHPGSRLDPSDPDHWSWIADGLIAIGMVGGATLTAAKPTIVCAAENTPVAPTVYGVDLSNYAHAVAPEELPDLYEPDANAPGRYRHRQAVYQAPLGESWLHYPVDKSCFYIEPREAGKDFAGRLYGPIPGDPFEKLGLATEMEKRLKGDRSYDDYYRIKLLLRTDDASAVARASKLLDAALTVEGEVYERESPVAEARRILDEFQETFARHGLAARREEQLLEAAKIHLALEALTVEFPDADYKTAESATHAVPKTIPEEAWSKPINGLRTAIAAPIVVAKIGQDLEVLVVLENVSDKPIKFSYRDLAQDANASVKPAKAKDGEEEPRELSANKSWFSGWAPLERMILQPGEKVVIVAPTIRFADKKNESGPQFGTSEIVAGAGEYTIGYSVSLSLGSSWARGADGVMRRISPAKGEWSGRLETGRMTVTVE